MSNILLPNDDGVDSALDLRKPNYNKDYANLHYETENTGEIGTIVIEPNTTEDDVLRQYAQKFPIEADRFIEEVKYDNANLSKLSGMSNGGRMMSIGRVPEILQCALKFVHGESFGDDKTDWIWFFRRNPKFMLGDHRVKATSNRNIIK